MSRTHVEWPLRRPPEDVLAEVLDRARRRRRRIRAIKSATAAVVLVAVAIPAAARMHSGGDPRVQTIDRPPTTVETLPPSPSEDPEGHVVPQPQVGGVETPAGGGTPEPPRVHDGLPQSDAAVRVLTDPQGDATGGGWPSGTRDNEPSLDILALDVDSDGRNLTFVQHLDGSPQTDPQGANGRFHRVSFWVPGHDTVQIYGFREPEATEVWFGFINSRGRPSANQHCSQCSITFDGPGRRVVLTVPLSALNEMDDYGVRFEPGVELSGFATSTEWRYSAFGMRTGGEVDTATRPDARFRIPKGES